VRTLELRLYGRSHPQTVSLFGPELTLRPHLSMREPIFRHPDLNFASLHIYEDGTIDDPQNTVDAAISMGRVVQDALSEIRDGRPFLDSEHGPIHTFKDHKTTLPEPFDDEYAVTEPQTPGEHRLAQLAEPEKDVAAGTKTLVVGPYLTRRRQPRSEAIRALDGNPRPPEARLDEAAGLAAAIDLQIVRTLMAPLASPRPATYIGSGKVEEFAA
jgi:hypothetical protein